MPNQKLTQKTKQSDNLATNDALMVVDTSDTSSSASGTSKYLTPDYLNVTVKVDIDNTAFKALPTSGATLVGFPGAGYMTVPLSVLVKMTPGATPNTASMGMKIGFVDGDSSYYWAETRFWPTSPTYLGEWFEFGQTPTSVKGLSTTSIENQKLLMYATGSVSPTATNSLEVYVTYKTVKI